MTEKSEDAYVYIIAPMKGAQFVAPVKVGLASSPNSRLATIQTAAPFKVGIYHAFSFPNRDIAREVERAFHNVLKRHQTHGEWFNLTPRAAVYHMAANVRAFLKVGLGMPANEVRENIRHSILAWGLYQ